MTRSRDLEGIGFQSQAVNFTIGNLDEICTQRSCFTLLMLQTEKSSILVASILVGYIYKTPAAKFDWYDQFVTGV